ncbi:hypothetical protein AMOR_51900 [Anaeromyxobacter oryzae]|uniref:Uncharacterized protein n=1 Tax=Anaeromyxobacter oryzae TaxID=2918170 RepID=A0ABN6N2P1_9BACT|nr:hypothetical protein AMOR_51900 [Anaeromyxobacter oryzae]
MSREGAPRSGGGAKPLDAGFARAPANAGAREHGPRAAGVGPRRLCRRGGAARPAENDAMRATADMEANP